MALITRISRLFKADFHAVLDQIEEPEQQLKQAIREMEDDLAASERRLKACALEQTALAASRDEVEASLAEIDTELDLCFASKKTGLAKTLVRKKLGAERLRKRLKAQQAANETWLGEGRASLDECRATLEGLRQKAEIFARRPAQADATDDFADLSWHTPAARVSEDEVEVAFLREQDRRSAS